MPIFEFECGDCRRKTTALVMPPRRVSDVRCKHCGGASLEKLYSRFASPKSEEARLEALADPSSFSGVDENDPASVARLVKRMGREMGEDLGEDFEGALDEEMGKAGGPPGGGEGTDDL